MFLINTKSEQQSLHPYYKYIIVYKLANYPRLSGFN